MGNTQSSPDDSFVCSGFQLGADGTMQFVDLQPPPINPGGVVAVDKDRGSEGEEVEGNSNKDKISSHTTLAHNYSRTRPKTPRPDLRRPALRSVGVVQRSKITKQARTARMDQTRCRRAPSPQAMSLSENMETTHDPIDQGQQPRIEGNLSSPRVMRGRTQVNYDGKHHPMDEVMRPGVVARRRARQEKRQAEILQGESVDQANDSHSNISEFASASIGALRSLTEPTSPSDDYSTPAARLRRRPQGTKPPSYDELWHPLNAVFDDNNDDDGESDPMCKQPEIGSQSDLAKDLVSDQQLCDGAPQGADSNERSLGVDQQPVLFTEGDMEHPERRRSARRSALNDDTFLKYYSHYHPIDQFKRPMQFAKMLKKKTDLANTTTIPDQRLKGFGATAVTVDADNYLPIPSQDASTTLGPTELSSTPSAPFQTNPAMMVNQPSPIVAPVANIDGMQSSSDRKNLYPQQKPLKWGLLSDLERQLFLLQRGGPAIAESNVLPLSWLSVKQYLFEYGDITLDSLNSHEGTDALVEQYERVRLGVQAFFGSPNEPKDKRDWIVYRAEGPDVFQKKPKKRYWRSEADQIVQPEMMTMNDDLRLASNTRIAASSEHSLSEGHVSRALPFGKSKKDLLNETCLEPPTPLGKSDNNTNDDAMNVDSDALTTSERNLVDSMRTWHTTSGTVNTAVEVADMTEMDTLLNSMPARVTTDESSMTGSQQRSNAKTSEIPSKATGFATSTLSAVVVNLAPAYQKSTTSSPLEDSQAIFPSAMMKPRYGKTKSRGQKRKADASFSIHEDDGSDHFRTTTSMTVHGERAKARDARRTTALSETDLPVENLPAGGELEARNVTPSRPRRQVTFAADVRARD